MRSTCQMCRPMVCAIALTVAATIVRAEVPAWRLSPDLVREMVNTDGPHNMPVATPADASQRGVPAPTIISLSGATLMRTFTTAPGSTHDTGLDLDMDGTIEPGDNPTCATDDGDIDADNVFGFVVFPELCRGVQLDQLAPGTSGAAGHHWTVYWREEGSVGGVEDLVDSQIGNPPGTIIPPFGPNANNPVWVNRNRFRPPLSSTSIGGFDLWCENWSDDGLDGLPNTGDTGEGDNVFTWDDVNMNGVHDLGEASEPFVDLAPLNGIYDCPTPQPLVQMAVSDVKSNQAFAIAPINPEDVRWDARPGKPGYGLNPAISPSTGTAAQSLRLDTTLGPDGINALEDRTVAIGSVSVLANPGLGMTEITDVELQWLLVHGRFSSGVDMNFVTRDVDSGTRNTYNNNLRVDVSWGHGENDGNYTAPMGNELGTQIRYSDKTSSSHVDPTVANARWSMGYTSSSTAAPATISNTLDVLRVDFTDATGEIGDTEPAILPTLANVTNGKYRIWSRQQYIRAKNPAFDDQQPVDCPANWPYLGDPDCAVRDYIRNVEDSDSAFPEIGTAFTPADALLANRFVLKKAMQVVRDSPDIPGADDQGVDGDGYSPNPDYDAALESLLISFFEFGTIQPEFVTGNYAFDPDGPGGVAAGQAINAANEIVGDFNLDGQRTLADIAKFADALQDPGRPACVPCTRATLADPLCVPAPFVFNNGGTLQYPAVIGDFNSDACFNEADADYFCTILTNGAGHVARSQCIDMFIAEGIALSQHEDVDRDGDVDCEDVLIIENMLQAADAAGYGRSLTVSDFDHAFLIGRNLAADQDDNGVINDTDLNIVLAAAGLTIGDCLGSGCICGELAAVPNNVIDLSDFGAFAVCFGANVVAQPECECSDLNADGDVNGSDFATLATIFSLTPDGVSPPNCLLVD